MSMIYNIVFKHTRQSSFSRGDSHRSSSLIFSVLQIYDGLLGLLSLGTRCGDATFQYVMKRAITKDENSK